jgi:hypothetical protein
VQEPEPRPPVILSFWLGFRSTCRALPWTENPVTVPALVPHRQPGRHRRRHRPVTAAGQGSGWSGSCSRPARNFCRVVTSGVPARPTWFGSVQIR